MTFPLLPGGAGSNGKVIIYPGGGQNIFEKLVGVKIDIGPVAFRARGAVCGMGDVLGNYGYVPCLKGERLS